MSSAERRPELPKHAKLFLVRTRHMGNRIKELREAAGLSQPELAKRVGTTKNQLGKLERSQRRLSDHWAERLAPHLGVAAYELFMPEGSGLDLARLVPLVGVIPCGNWREAVESADGSVPTVAKGGNVFALKTVGDSMDLLSILDGGYVFIDPDDRDLIDGRVYAVMNGESETTVKRYNASPARLVPCSSNPEHREIEIGKEPLMVIGRVVGSYSPL